MSRNAKNAEKTLTIGFLRCPKCNPYDLLIACKCSGCQCEGSFAPDGDFMPEGYGYNVVGDIVPVATRK